jgi:MFS transporter, DHA1 family, multidrug resistance protein
VHERSGDSPQPLWDATFGWFLLLCFLWNVGQGAFAPLLPTIMRDLHLGFATAGLLGSGFAVARVLVDLPAGLVAERLGVAYLLHGAAGFLLAGGLLSAAATSFEGMLLARALGGLGSGLGNILSILYLMRRGAPSHRNRRANLYELAVIAGMGISASLAGGIATRWGWRLSFGLAAAVLAATWIVAAHGVLPGLRDLRVAAEPAGPADRRDGARAQRGPVVALFVASFAQAFAWGGGMSTLLPLYGGSALGLSSAAIGGAMAVAFGIEVCLLVPVGWAADVWGKVPVMVPGFIAMLVGAGLAPLTVGVQGYGAAYAVLTAGMSVWMLVPALLAERMAGGFGGRAAGQYRLVTDFGFIVGPATVGWLIEQFGFATGAAAIVGVLALSILLSLCFLRK